MHEPKALAFAENLAALKRASRLAASVAFDELGLSDTQLRVLRYVATEPSVTQADLARATETDPSLLGRSLQRMLKRRMLRRTANALDRRSYVISLGADGKRFLAMANEASERLVKQLVAPLDAKDLADFERITRKIVSAVDKMSQWEDPASRYVSRRVPVKKAVKNSPSPAGRAITARGR